MATKTVIGNGSPVTHIDPAKVTREFFKAEPELQEKLEAALEAAGYTKERAKAALTVYALRHSAKAAWSVAGQLAGLGDPTKAKSGASGARSLYNAAIGKAGLPGRIATEHAPAVSRARTKQQQGASKQQAKAS